MCQSIKLLSQTKSENLVLREDLNFYQLTFNNLFIELSLLEFDTLKAYIYNLETDYWEQNPCCLRMKRKIPIPTTQQNLMLLFNKQEITELKLLLAYNEPPKKMFLSFDDIDYLLFLN